MIWVAMSLGSSEISAPTPTTPTDDPDKAKTFEHKIDMGGLVAAGRQRWKVWFIGMYGLLEGEGEKEREKIKKWKER